MKKALLILIVSVSMVLFIGCAPVKEGDIVSQIGGTRDYVVQSVHKEGTKYVVYATAEYYDVENVGLIKLYDAKNIVWDKNKWYKK